MNSYPIIIYPPNIEKVLNITPKDIRKPVKPIIPKNPNIEYETNLAIDQAEELRKYYFTLESIKTPEGLQSYINELLLIELAKTVNPDDRLVSTNQTQENRKKFELMLIKYFAYKILLNYVVKIGTEVHGGSMVFSTEFLYYDRDSRLCINIIIEEPYSETSFMPKHYCGPVWSLHRFMTRFNWVILRFSEKQAILYPERCCKEIAELIHELTPKNIDLHGFKDIKPLMKDIQPNYKLALKLAENRYRDTYLIKGRDEKIKLSDLGDDDSYPDEMPF